MNRLGCKSVIGGGAKTLHNGQEWDSLWLARRLETVGISESSLTRQLDSVVRDLNDAMV